MQRGRPDCCSATDPDGQQGDVIGTLPRQHPDSIGEQIIEAGSVTGPQPPMESGKSVVDVSVAVLNQPIGVQKDDRARRHPAGVAPARHVRVRAEEHVMA
jgi:hypothetical protein